MIYFTNHIFQDFASFEDGDDLIFSSRMSVVGILPNIQLLSCKNDAVNSYFNK